MESLAEGDTKYAIAQVMEVRGPTVDSIVATAKREQAQTSPGAPAPKRRKGDR